MFAVSEAESPLTIQHLQTAIENQGKITEKLDQNNSKEICSQILKLDLQFVGIGSLHLAWLLTNIEELYLSNNILTSADGLQTLRNLRWLDLSFNKIRTTKELKSLTKLEVLALHGNQVPDINREFCKNLKDLRVLTLGNNMIANKEDILSLRKLPKLGSLTLKNNPCCQTAYPSYVVAHVPNLVYLDYDRITDELRHQSNQLHSDSLTSVEKETESARKTSVHRTHKQKEEARHRMAGVLALDDDSLFKKLFENDQEMNTMMCQQGVQAIMRRFEEEFKRICLQVFEDGLLHAEQRQNEIKLLKEALKEAKDASNVVVRIEISVLDTEIDQLLLRARELNIDEESAVSSEDTDQFEARENRAHELQETSEEVLDTALMKLFANEVTLANQMKEVLELAENELGSMVSAFLSNAAEHFEEGRRYAYSFYCKLREITTKLADANVTTKENSEERFLKPTDHSGKVVGTNTSSEEDIFEGGDTLTAALARIHDRHLEVINSRERQLKDHLTSWLHETLEEFYRLEWKRHRTRLEEIITLSEEKKKEFLTALPIDFR